ncbi:MAG: PfkB family carbohydrate kinase [Sphaerochaeta sp.]|nr:PfkB family carbohydrate kinase [Sphaerochaeta sp.]
MQYDIVMIGHISQDIMIDHLNNKLELVGGAVVYSSASAAASGAKVKVVTKLSKEDGYILESLKRENITWEVCPSKASTSIKNIYYTADKERRDVFLISQADPFSLEEVLGDETRIFHLAGLFGGEVPDTLIKPLFEKAEVAMDAQGVLRCLDEEGNLAFRDWERKKELLPFIKYFKTDAAEAEILTGLSNREEAARLLNEWGSGEVMLTHNTEVMVCVQGEIFTAPYTHRSNEGRTGRGDTTFAAYLAWRKEHSAKEATAYAAALCSMKMEVPGVFKGSVDDVLKRMEEDVR